MTRHTRDTCWFVLLTLAACTSQLENEATADDLVLVSPDSVVTPPDPGSPGAPEYGIGIIHFDQLLHPPPRHDTLVLRTAPSPDAPVIARFVFDMPTGAQWRYVVSDSTGPISGNIIEFGYEESGLPFDSITPDSAWVRTLYTVEPIRRAWARRVDRTGMLFWTSHLPKYARFFLRDEFIALHESPGGPRIDFPLEQGNGYPSKYDYRLAVDSVSGRWIRARVVTPSDACVAESAPARDTTAWLEYVDGRGRPRVWYFARSC